MDLLTPIKQHIFILVPWRWQIVSVSVLSKIPSNLPRGVDAQHPETHQSNVPGREASFL